MNEWIRSVEEWRTFQQVALQEPTVAVVLHTNNPDPLRGQIIYMALALQNTGAVLDVPRLGGAAVLRNLIGPLFNGDEHVKAFHNAKTSLRFLLPLGIVPSRIFDSMLAEQLLSAGEQTQDLSLEEVAQRRLQLDLPQPASTDAYALLARARAVYNLRQYLVPRIVQARLVKCAQIEFNCAVPTAAMENAGLRLDAARLRSLIEQSATQMREHSRLFVQGFAASQSDLFGDATLNLHADAQVLQFLQEHGVPVSRVNRSTIKPLINRFPALQHLLDYRQAAGDKALEGYIEAIHPATGRIHPTYAQLAAATGRFGCSNPNMQSFPRLPQYRACIVPAPGKAFIIADYSQIELRIVAQISKDARMLAAFRANGDLHATTAGILTGLPAHQITKAQRQAAKAVNFGLIYAMGARGLAAYAEQTYGVEMSITEAEQFRTRFFQAYAGVQAWHTQVRREQPTTVRTLSGRLRNVPQGMLAQALNSPVQGTGADILKRALALLYPALRPLGGAIVAVVHDEVLVEAPQTQAQAAAVLVSRYMEEASREFLPDVPCPVEAKVAASWAEK